MLSAKQIVIIGTTNCQLVRMTSGGNTTTRNQTTRLLKRSLLAAVAAADCLSVVEVEQKRREWRLQ